MKQINEINNLDLSKFVWGKDIPREREIKNEDIIQNVLQPNSTSAFYGLPKNGKSFVLLSLLTAVAYGLPKWNDFKVKKGKCLYLCGEGYGGVINRIRAIEEKNNLMPNNELLIYPKNFFFTSASIDSLTENLSKKHFKPDLIVIDTATRYFCGNPNDTFDAVYYMDLCNMLATKYQCAVVNVMHAGKDKNSSSIMGNTAFTAMHDNVYRVSLNKGVIEIEQTCSKDSPLKTNLFFKMENVVLQDAVQFDGSKVQTCVISPLES